MNASLTPDIVHPLRVDGTTSGGFDCPWLPPQAKPVHDGYYLRRAGPGFIHTAYWKAGAWFPGIFARWPCAEQHLPWAGLVRGGEAA